MGNDEHPISDGSQIPKNELQVANHDPRDGLHNISRKRGVDYIEHDQEIGDRDHRPGCMMQLNSSDYYYHWEHGLTPNYLNLPCYSKKVHIRKSTDQSQILNNRIPESLAQPDNQWDTEIQFGRDWPFT